MAAFRFQRGCLIVDGHGVLKRCDGGGRFEGNAEYQVVAGANAALNSA